MSRTSALLTLPPCGKGDSGCPARGETASVWHGRGVHQGSRWSAKGHMKGGMWPAECGQERHNRNHKPIVKYCNACDNSTPRIDPTLSHRIPGFFLINR